MFNVRLPPVLLAVLVSAPALIAGRLAANGELPRAGSVALLELVVIAVAATIAAQSRLD
jgi:hypothetical protein